MTESRFGMTEVEDLPEDLRDRIAEVARRSGFVPNIFRALGHRPAELRAFLDYHEALMDKTTGLTKAERELVVVATSAANHCTYCIVAHGAILRIRSKDPHLADQVAANPWQARLDERGRAITDLALALARTPEHLARPISPVLAPQGSATTRSGTSAPLPRCSRRRTGWRTSPPCSPTPSSTSWAATRGEGSAGYAAAAATQHPARSSIQAVAAAAAAGGAPTSTSSVTRSGGGGGRGNGLRGGSGGELRPGAQQGHAGR